MALKPGEKVASAVPYRDEILVFGTEGSVLRVNWSYRDDRLYVSRELDLERIR